MQPSFNKSPTTAQKEAIKVLHELSKGLPNNEPRKVRRKVPSKEEFKRVVDLIFGKKSSITNFFFDNK